MEPFRVAISTGLTFVLTYWQPSTPDIPLILVTLFCTLDFQFTPHLLFKPELPLNRSRDTSYPK